MDPSAIFQLWTGMDIGLRKILWIMFTVAIKSILV